MRERNHRIKAKGSIRTKILALSVGVSIPFLIMIGYLLVSMANYSRNYEQIVSSMTVANNYNLNFKEEMDESLYKLVVGYVTFDNIGEDPTLKDPYVLIRELRGEFRNLITDTSSEESKVWLESLLRNIDTLQKRVDDIKASMEAGDSYDENIERLDNNIYILTELIQDDIQYYIYYQTKSMESVNQAMHHQVNTFICVCVAVVLFMLIMVTAFSVYIVNEMLQPLYVLRAATEEMAGGNFAVRAQTEGSEELQSLSDSFNHMASNMEDLIDEVKEDQQKMRKADLRLLQEQINPHFLYNTLDTIVWLVEANETDQAVNMIVTLSNFFRMVLSKGKELITISEEEQHIGSYLEIQSMRYHDIMEYDIQFDQVILDYQIPKLTLQPIVENALYHGLKEKRAKGFIHIHGEKDGECIRLTVRDNGVGMEAEELEELRGEITRPCKETERGFGLANVNERIRMYYGAEYGMEIQSIKGKGTTVELVIPAIKMQRKPLGEE